MKKIKFGKVEKPTPEELQRAIDADLIRTTEQVKERLEIIWKWKGSGLRPFATDGELEHLTAVCEQAEHAVYQCEIIERTYQQFKRKQCDLAAEDWREIISAIRYAELDPSGHEATPDWDWFINHVLCMAQGLKDEGLKAALQARCDIISRVKKELTNNQGASCEMLAMLKETLAAQKEELAMLKDIKANTSNVASKEDCARIENEIENTRTDIADIGDTMCEIVGTERKPPEPKEVGEMSRRDLFDHIKRLDKSKRGYLDTFLEKSKWTFRGFTAREIYKDAEGLRRFINAERMAINREDAKSKPKKTRRS